MEHASPQSYKEVEIATATPQRLHLMLIEGAIRFAQQTLLYWEQEDNEQACESLIRCRQIVTAILTGIKDDGSEVVKNVAAIYEYLFHTLTEANRVHNPQHLRDVIRVLEIEQETWRQLCEQLPEAPIAEETTIPEEVTATDQPAIAPISTPHLPAFGGMSHSNQQAANSGISFEA